MKKIKKFPYPWLAKSIESIVFSALIVYLTLIIFSIATDFNGDPNDYLYRARHLFSMESLLNFNRFIGYPIFIKVTSLNLTHLNFTFFAQLGLFIFSLRYFSHSISVNPFIRTLIYVPAFLPAVAYLPKLLFPDCVILSLLLMFCGSLLRRQFFVSAVVIFILTIVKLVFIFGVFFWATILFASNIHRWRSIFYSLYITSIILIIPVVFAIVPFPLYQTVVQNPNFQLEIERANPLPVDSNTLVLCNGSSHKLLLEVEPGNIMAHSSDSFYLPIGSNVAQKWGCSKAEIKAIQRQLIANSFLSDPQFHFQKFAYRYFRNLFVFSDAPHTSWMLDGKLHLQVKSNLEKYFYSEGEIGDFKQHNITPPMQPNLRMLSLMHNFNLDLQRLLSKFIIISLLLCVLLHLWLKNSLIGASTILGLLFSYTFVITFFAFGYDRYLAINYFLWLGIIGLMLNSVWQYIYDDSWG